MGGDNLDNPGQLFQGAPPNRAALVPEVGHLAAPCAWQVNGGRYFYGSSTRTRKNRHPSVSTSAPSDTSSHFSSDSVRFPSSL